MPGSELSCPRCAQKFTVQEGQIQYRCPPCRGVFETATGRYVFELPAARNAPPRAKLPAPMPLSDVDSSSLDSASSTPTEGGKKEADAPVEAPAAKRPRQEEGRAAGGAASSLQEMVAEVVQIKKKKLDAALKRQAEDTSTIRSKAEQVVALASPPAL